ILPVGWAVLWNTRIERRQDHDLRGRHSAEARWKSGRRDRCQRRVGRTRPRRGGSRSQCVLKKSEKKEDLMATNRGVAYLGPGKVEVQSIDFPKLQNPQGKKIDHGVILKVVSTNICGSDQHMVRGRTTAPAGLVLGHEITGEVIEKGRDVEYLEIGDLVSVPFNVACGRCRTCREGDTGVCLHV